MSSDGEFDEGEVNPNYSKESKDDVYAAEVAAEEVELYDDEGIDDSEEGAANSEEDEDMDDPETLRDDWYMEAIQELHPAFGTLALIQKMPDTEAIRIKLNCLIKNFKQAFPNDPDAVRAMKKLVAESEDFWAHISEEWHDHVTWSERHMRKINALVIEKAKSVPRKRVSFTTK